MWGNEKSLSGELSAFCHLLTIKIWVYFLKSKDQVFEKFLEWKAIVERSTGRKLKVFRMNNGGEFTSKEFKAHWIAKRVYVS